MGNSGPSKEQEDNLIRNFDVSRYRGLHPELSEKEVREMYRMFVQANPSNGKVSSGRVFCNYYEDQEMKRIGLPPQNAQLDFDSFFEVMSQFLKAKKARHGNNIDFGVKDTDPQVICVNCGPTPTIA